MLHKMNVCELTKAIDMVLKEKEYANLFRILDQNREIVPQSNELSYLYYLCSINKDRYEKTGNPGMVIDKQSVSEFYDALCNLKKMVQRVSYCPEYDATQIPLFMNTVGANATELLWIAQSSTPDPKRTMDRIIHNNTEYVPKKNSDYKQHYDYHDAKIEFIICSNDINELEETIYYINRLEIPAGVSVSVTSITDSLSICSGYNEGMNASSAQYKVYLHQDVRIIEESYISRILDLFMSDPLIGLIGFIGTKTFPKDGTMWNVDRFGAMIETHIHETCMVRNYNKKKDLDVMLCDGFMLATQYDIPWREEIFDGWDFYDASQCMEFRRHGYKIMVPYQEKPWCVHDCGFVNLKNYDKYKERFLKEYGS